MKTIHYYCSKCFEKKESFNNFFGLPVNEKNDKYDIVEERNKFDADLQTNCHDCEKIIIHDDAKASNYYHDIYVCNNCEPDENIQEYVRIDELFHCYICKKDYEIDANENDTMKCEEISKLDKFEQKQTFFGVDDTITQKIVKEKL